MNDGNGATDLATVTIDIEPVNDAPVIIRDNLISNGDFSNGLVGWVATGTVVERDGTARFGGGNTPTDGVLSQTFDTIPGETYEVSFEYDSTRQLREQTIQAISVDDGSSNLLGEVVASTSTVPGKELLTFSFVAESTRSTLTFTDTSASTSGVDGLLDNCLLYTSPSPRDQRGSRMPSSA